MDLNVAHRKWADEGGNEFEKDTLLEAAKVCGDLRRDVRSKCSVNFAGRKENCKNSSEIWKEVKVRACALAVLQTARQRS